MKILISLVQFLIISLSTSLCGFKKPLLKFLDEVVEYLFSSTTRFPSVKSAMQFT